MMPTLARVLKVDATHDVVMDRRPRLADFTVSSPPDSFEPLDTFVEQAPRCVRPEQPLRADFTEALSALTSAVQQLHAERDRWLNQCQHEVVKLGIAIAERLLRSTLSTRPDAVVNLAQTALAWTVGANCLRLRLHPSDCELIEKSVDARMAVLQAHTSIVRDDSLSRGDCVVETEHGTIDARLSTMLDRLAGELLGDDTDWHERLTPSLSSSSRE